MTEDIRPPEDVSAIRRLALARWKEQNGSRAPFQPDAATLGLLHELEVHQIELEMQNAELETARQDAQAALRKATDLYDFAPVGYLNLDVKGTICAANNACATLLNRSRASLIGRPGRGCFAADAQPLFDRFLSEVFQTRTRQRCELLLQVNERSPLEVELEAVISPEGDECRVALMDISQRNDRLVMSKLESIGVLAGGIAHDFNNLLMGIVLNIDLARQNSFLDPEMARCLDDAKNTAMAARHLAHRFLAFSRGTSLVRKPTQMSDLLRSAALQALSGSTANLELRLALDLPPAFVDEGQMTQVIRNLVLNAREAMPEGGLITIEGCHAKDAQAELPLLPPGDFIRVSVIDRGSGISATDLPKIFDPYFSTKQRGEQKGMGLGLTICHTVVHRHGGAITVKPTVGGGTTFSVYLPVSNVPTDTLDLPVSRSAPRNGHILVMDDDDGVREVFGRVLRRLGHTTVLVENGEAAIKAFAQSLKIGPRFDALFLDLTIRNGLGGLHTMEELRKLDPAVHAVVMSGYSEDVAIRNFKALGFSAAIVKPFDFEKLRACVADALEDAPADD